MCAILCSTLKSENIFKDHTISANLTNNVFNFFDIFHAEFPYKKIKRKEKFNGRIRTKRIKEQLEFHSLFHLVSNALMVDL